jgi:cyclopropane fatty-acyl-phospholipid synthase-like methyltransferase/predicted regulator of amino acid metabolism with ACT domain
MISFDQIDWNKLWEENMKIASGVASWSGTGAERGIGRWNDAKNRPTRTGNDEYVKELLKKLTLGKDDSVLDIGCGNGLLSIPVARKVKTVTALDVSKELLEVLKKAAFKKGVTNIEYLQADWQTIKPVDDISLHDIVIASRCLGMFDLKEELIKINKIAKKLVYLTRIVKEDDWISPKIYELLGKQFKPLPNYYYVYNLLYQLGIRARIDYISAEVEEKYKSINQAINVWRWKLNGLTDEEEKELRNFLENNLINDRNNNWSTGLFDCKWALISWVPKEYKDKYKLSQREQKEFVNPDFDWNHIWNNLNRDRIYNDKSTSAHKWDAFAEHFNRGVTKDWKNKNSYINQLIKKLEVNAHDTVLDIGCASGGVSIPLASKVKSVTGIDISGKMIAFFKKNISEYSLDNINAIIGQWEDVATQTSFPKHDIVIASRCLSGPELKEKLKKINKIASKKVYFTWITEISSLQKSVYQILNRKFKQEPEYIYIFNLLYSMNINPKIDFIYCQNQESFASIDDAIERYQWILGDVTQKEKEKLKNYFDKVYLKKEDGSIISPPNIESKWEWVVFSWEIGSEEG